MATAAHSQAGAQASARNRAAHGLCQRQSQSFYPLDNEGRERFAELRDQPAEEHQPETESDRILVQRPADREWLRTRCFAPPAWPHA